jgi:hypothetical protein
MNKAISRSGVRKVLVVVLILVVAVLGGLGAYYKNVYSDPEVVFNAMIENSLRSGSIVKHINQEDETQSVDQIMRLQQGEQHIAQGLTNLTQTGFSTAEVETESIGTPTTDYVRYRSIETDQKSQDGSDLDFSKVVGIWGVTEATESTSGELYNELALGVIPSGKLPADERAELLKIIKENNVYEVDYNNVARTTVNGRPTYEYTVKVSPEPYIGLLKEFAKAIGLTHLDEINPEDYKGAEPLEFKLSVDVLTRRVNTVTYSSGRTESYESFGGRKEVDEPTDTITINELQTLIQEVQ